MIREYEGKLATVAAEIRDQKRNALAEARRILEDANALVERSVREIRETNASRETLKNARTEISALRDKVDEEEKITAPPESGMPNPIHEGMTVRLRAGGEPGKVESLLPDKGAAFVLFGSIRMKVSVSDLVPAAPHAAPVRISTDPGRTDALPSAHEVDVRGMNGDEAVGIVDKFIDSAILSGLHRVDVIHGKGTGALRKRIADFLADHPRVRAFRLGEWNEGGSGATIIDLGD
jgi:DNA mismatch repair protein MutS2